MVLLQLQAVFGCDAVSLGKDEDTTNLLNARSDPTNDTSHPRRHEASIVQILHCTRTLRQNVGYL